MSYTYQYPHAAITADCIIYGFDGEHLKILLIQRGIEPYKGFWALPGGFMRMDETIEQTATRELFEETGLRDVFMSQFKMFSTVSRDPRERVVTVAFIALVRPEDYVVVAGDDAVKARWFDEADLPPLAFDHDVIIEEAHAHLKEQLRARPIAAQLLNKIFSMGELQRVFEEINRTSYDRRNFQRKAEKSGLLEEVDEVKDLNEDTEEDSAGVEAMTHLDYAFRKNPLFSRRVGRKPSRMFTFRDVPVSKDRKDDSDASIKDIFDY